jgi:hypothetical protein
LPTDRVWYNLDFGAFGSSYGDEERYHLRKDAPALNPDLFVWNAPIEYTDVGLSPRVWDVRPYWIDVPPKALPPLVNGRTITEEFRFGEYTVRLYEAPPPGKTPVGIGDSFDLLAGPQEVNSYHGGQNVELKTWWHIRKQPLLDYSYSLILTAASDHAPMMNTDAALTIDGKPTSQLFPANGYSFKPETFKLPDNLAPGNYELWLTVYFSGDLKRLPLTPSPDFPTEEKSSVMRVSSFAVIK